MEQAIIDLLRSETPAVLVTVLARSGYAPRRPGARMLVSDAAVTGSLGGGLAEAKAVDAARQALLSGVSARLHFDLRNQGPETADMPCGGETELLVEPLSQTQLNLFEGAAAALAEGKPGCWLVDITNPQHAQRAFYLDLTALPPGVTVTQDSVPGLTSYGDRTLYMEPLQPPPVVLLCGGGQVSLCIARAAEQAGFLVDVVDERPEFSSVERFPMARAAYVAEEFTDLETRCGIGQQHYMVIATRGHRHDLDVLTQALHTKARYIGVFGSRKKREELCASLREQGVPNAELACVRCPIGIAIGADTPEEIAVSVVAELVAARSGRLPFFRAL